MIMLRTPLYILCSGINLLLSALLFLFGCAKRAQFKAVFRFRCFISLPQRLDTC